MSLPVIVTVDIDISDWHPPMALPKGVIPSASMTPAPEKYRLKQIWETAGFNEIVNDDSSITYTFMTDLFVKKRLQWMNKQVDRMAIDFLVN